MSLGYPILSDTERSTANAYGVVTGDTGSPKRWTFYIGTDGLILHVDRSVDAVNAGADVAARLEALDIQKRE